MKKLILTALAVVSFTFANAQEEATATTGFANGDIFISGSVGYSSSSTGEFKTNTFTFSPRAAYFATENIAIGAKLKFNNETNKNGGNKAKNDSFGIGAFGRYYFTPASKFSIFAELGLDYRSSKRDDGNTATPDVKSTGFGIAVGPGVSYFISNNFALEANWGALGYGSDKPKDVPNAKSTDTFNLNADLEDITLGLVYKF
ncbi:outer membrane protein [Aquimarina longa]|uniref:outer membrane protein n=1 Tax=Aquimarina longa TaxID=1080221 RepID=UPI0007810800|nr:outer membrane beta-barrel protein [Aquimarina longa]